MLYDGLSLAEGTAVSNLTIASGTSNPGSPTTGELFYRTDSPNEGLYVYTGTEWQAVGSGNVSFDSLNVKPAVRAATTANITLSGAQTIDGVVLVAGDRVLVKNQNTGSQNGIYVVASGSWTRSTDFDGAPTTEVKAGDFTFVTEGTTQADTGWVLTNNGTITIGTTALTFAQFSSGSSALTSTYIGYGSGSNLLTGSASFTWDNSTGTLSLTPSSGSTATVKTSGGKQLNIASSANANNGLGISIDAAAAPSGQGGMIWINAGAGTGTNLAGSIMLAAGATGTGAGGGMISFTTGTTSTERFRILQNGAWSVGSTGTAYGTSGQVLTSNGNAAPTWQNVSSTTTATNLAGGSANQIPYQTGAGATSFIATGTSGQVLTSNGSGSAPTWQTAAGSSSFGNTTTFGDGTAAVTLQGNQSASEVGARLTVQAGALAATGAGGSLTLKGGNANTFGPGGDVNITSGNAVSSAPAGNITIAGGTQGNSSTRQVTTVRGSDTTSNYAGDVVVRGGDTTGGAPGRLTLRAGNSTGPNSATFIPDVNVNGGNVASAAFMDVYGGNVNITGGNISSANAQAATQSVGSVIISGGIANANTGPITNGYVSFKTGVTALTERFRILATGAWSVGSTGTAYGTSGQVLTSNGNAAPTWQTVSVPSSFTKYDEFQGSVTASATTNIDCSTANNFTVTMSANITTLTFSNIPASGRNYSMTLYITQDATGGREIVWPAAVKWPNGTAPSLTATATKIDVITLVTYNAGTSWLGFVAAQNM